MGKNKIAIVFNLDRHDQPGSHWVSLFIDLECKFIFYFDSAGNPIPEEIKVLKDRLIKEAMEMHMKMKMKNVVCILCFLLLKCLMKK